MVIDGYKSKTRSVDASIFYLYYYLLIITLFSPVLFASILATVNSTQVRRLGCITRNLCSLQLAFEILLGPEAKIVCGAPWATRISGVLLLLALAMQRVLV